MTKEQLRTKRALRNATSHSVARYLMSNTYGRLDGAEKAREHRFLCEAFVSAYFDIDPNDIFRLRRKEYEAVHDHTQQLTGYLDREIGFPVDDLRPPYEELEPLFFDRFYELAFEALRRFR